MHYMICTNLLQLLYDQTRIWKLHTLRNKAYIWYIYTIYKNHISFSIL